MSEARGTIRAESVHKGYLLGRTHLRVLRGVSFEVAAGEFVAVVGASGSGKSTLLHLLGLLDRPDDGKVFLDGAEVEHLSSARRNRMRCRDIGFVFQFYHLLPELNVLENTLLPAKVDSSVPGWLSRRGEHRARAVEALGQVGLKERLRHRPKELSGGERQRVAIARALMNRPRFLLADEPTGNLDSKTGRQIMKVLRKVSEKVRQTVVMVTHDAGLARQADRVLHLADGRLSD
jgi:lipoprotein-releasing system ATP-binding protein